MASFIMAMNINPTAKAQRVDLSHQVNESLETFSRNGVHVERLFTTLGRYDFLALFETDDQTVAFRVASQISALGTLTTETWPVIPYEDFSQLLG